MSAAASVGISRLISAPCYRLTIIRWAITALRSPISVSPAADVFSATIDPIVHLHPKGHWDAYIVGGGGLYHEYENLTAPTLIPGFFGFYPGQVILSSYSVNKPGANIGAGVAFGTKWHAKLYAEARWNHVFGAYGGPRMDYIPVTFGVRW